MNDVTTFTTTTYRCPDPECGGPVQIEVTRPEGGGEIISEAYKCLRCRKPLDLSELKTLEEELEGPKGPPSR